MSRCIVNVISKHEQDHLVKKKCVMSKLSHCSPVPVLYIAKLYNIACRLYAILLSLRQFTPPLTETNKAPFEPAK